VENKYQGDKTSNARSNESVTGGILAKLRKDKGGTKKNNHQVLSTRAIEELKKSQGGLGRRRPTFGLDSGISTISREEEAKSMARCGTKLERTYTKGSGE